MYCVAEEAYIRTLYYKSMLLNRMVKSKAVRYTGGGSDNDTIHRFSEKIKIIKTQIADTPCIYEMKQKLDKLAYFYTNIQAYILKKANNDLSHPEIKVEVYDNYDFTKEPKYIDGSIPYLIKKYKGYCIILAKQINELKKKYKDNISPIDNNILSIDDILLSIGDILLSIDTLKASFVKNTIPHIFTHIFTFPSTRENQKDRLVTLQIELNKIKDDLTKIKNIYSADTDFEDEYTKEDNVKQLQDAELKKLQEQYQQYLREQEDNNRKSNQRIFIDRALPKNASTGGSPKIKRVSKKDILGKERCIYKISGDRKEYVKYKGDLITLKDYKNIMKKKK
jgi:hypothetical protein